MFQKRLWQALRHHQRAMVAQHHHPLVAQIGDQPLAFLAADRDALKIMIGDLPGKGGGIEADRAQSLGGGAHRHACRRVGVDDAMGVGQMAVEHAMLDKSGAVDRIGAAIQHRAVNVDLDQIGRGHFMIAQAERVDQEGAFLSGHPHGDVVIDELGPAHMVEYAVAGGQLLARLPFGGGHIGAFCGAGHGRSSLISWPGLSAFRAR